MTAYVGPNRRRHKVMVTDNTEYHLRDHRVVAVRDRKGNWKPDHTALGAKLVGHISVEGSWRFHEVPSPSMGSRLCFSNDLVTSPLTAVLRAPREVVGIYPQFGVMSGQPIHR